MWWKCNNIESCLFTASQVISNFFPKFVMITTINLRNYDLVTIYGRREISKTNLNPKILVSKLHVYIAVTDYKKKQGNI